MQILEQRAMHIGKRPAWQTHPAVALVALRTLPDPAAAIVDYDAIGHFLDQPCHATALMATLPRENAPGAFFSISSMMASRARVASRR